MTALSGWTETRKIFPFFRSLLLSLAFLFLLPLLYSHSLLYYEPVVFWNLAIPLTQQSWLRFFFLIAFSGVFCPNFLFNLQKLHNDLCRYHTSIVVVVIVVVFHLIWSYLFLSSYKEWRRGFICTVVVFVCFFQKDLITLSDIRNYPLTSLDHISPWSFSLDHKSEISSI